MKKLCSVLLAVLMILPMAIPAFAQNIDPESSKSQIPVIRILGDGEPMYDKDGNKLFHIRSLMSDDSNEESEENDNTDIYESIANVLFPFLVDGLLNDEWDAYYENLQKEISELTGDAKLDCNGEAVEGTGISEKRKEFLEYARTHDKKGKKGFYGLYDYHFWYDWRLDPMESAKKLHEYIQDVKDVTHSEKVAINASCIGTIVTTAYVKMYGVDDIQGIGYTGSLANGAEILSESISGKFDTNSSAINRILMDSAYLGIFNFGDFIDSTIEMVLATGLVEIVENDIRDKLYNKLAYGVTSALALSTFYTYPSYWAAVSAEDYHDALVYVFGENYDDPDHEYAGLIAKIENYDREVRQNFDSIIRSISAGGANFAAISKYGFQILPICSSYDAVSDQFVSVKRSSFGATTSTIYDTLGDDYILSRQELELGKYISPDKQIDASTCIYPDYTWFVKNSSHSEYTDYEIKILYDVSTADRQLTVEDFPWSQFMVYDYENDTMEAMTEENCKTEQWEADESLDKGNDKFKFLFNFITALLKWLTQLVNILSK